MKAKIKELREQAHKAFLEARGFSADMAKPENVAKVAELEGKFNAAHADGTAKMAEADRLEAHQRLVDSTDAAIATLEAPAPPLGRDPGEAQRGRPGEPLSTLTPATLEQFLQVLSAGAGGGRSAWSATRDAKRRRLLAAKVDPEVHMAAFLAYLRSSEEGYGVPARVLRDGKVAPEYTAAILGGAAPAEVHALLQSTADLGGFLVPDDFRAQVIKDLAGFAVIRSMARVERTSRSALVFPSIVPATTDADIYSSGYTGAWRAEGYVTGGTAPTVQNQPRFGQERVPVHTWAPNAVEVTTELLEDSAADLDMILAEIIAETKALDEDSAFINGNGVGKPLGIQNSGAATVITGSAALILYGGLVDLFTTLPAQYRQNGTFLMSSLTYGAILKLVDSQLYPIITPNTTPNTLWGRPIKFSEFMPEIAAGTEPIIFGDFRYFVIADRQELRIQRLLERFAPNVGILPTARTGGQVVRQAAFKIQTCSA